MNVLQKPLKSRNECAKMSVHTYFCFCCLSTTDEFINIPALDEDTNYLNILSEIFSVNLFPNHTVEDDVCHICVVCAKSLRAIQQFQINLLNTLHVLKTNGIISLSHDADANVIVDMMTYEHGVVDDIKMELDYEVGQEYVSDTSASPIRTVIRNEPADNSVNKRRASKNDKARRSQMDPYIGTLEGKDLKCVVCGVVQMNKYMYHQHMNAHFPNHICDTCGKGFVSEKKLKRHLPAHKHGPFKCDICDAVFANFNTLSSHRQRKHVNNGLVYKCGLCPQRFRTPNGKQRHLSSAHGTEPDRKYVCSHCGKRWTYSSSLSAHIRNTHMRDRAPAPETRELRCQICWKAFPRKKSLVVHMRTHTGEKRFGCNECGKRFIQKYTLLCHLKTHHHGNDDSMLVE